MLKRYKSCQNADAKNWGYYIGREAPLGGDAIRFVAKLNWNDEEPILASLNANQGECNDLKTYKGSQQCGIGKQLIGVCLKDKYATAHGGLRIRQYNMIQEYEPLEVWDDPAFVTNARKYCKTIVEISCDPDDDIPKIVCKAYIEAAKRNKYQMMFVSKPIDENNKPKYHGNLRALYIIIQLSN